MSEVTDEHRRAHRDAVPRRRPLRLGGASSTATPRHDELGQPPADPRVPKPPRASQPDRPSRRQATWARLKAYAALELPMGCGTNNAEGSNLRQVGLVGGHAYSILDVREAATRAGEVAALAAALRTRWPRVAR